MKALCHVIGENDEMVHFLFAIHPFQQAPSSTKTPYKLLILHGSSLIIYQTNIMQ